VNLVSNLGGEGVSQMSLDEARARLREYLAACWLKHEDLDLLVLRRREDDLISAARRSAYPPEAPF